jgi:hypothetical protein
MFLLEQLDRFLALAVGAGIVAAVARSTEAAAETLEAGFISLSV